MSKGKKSSRFFGIAHFAFAVVGLALLTGIAAYGSVSSPFVLVNSAAEFFGLKADSQPYLQNNQLLHSQASPLDVTVSLPAVSSTPGIVLVPITVGDLTGQGIFSYDLQITFNPSVVTPASPAYFTPGTLSSAMAVSTNTSNAGHLILGAFQGSPLDGDGTLIFLRFNVSGTPGQSSTLVFENYTDPSPAFHPGFEFNDGTPLAITTNGSITVVAAGSPTSTNTRTPTATATATSTATATPTFTPSGTPTATPVCTNTVSIPNLTGFFDAPITVPVNVSNMTGTGAVSAGFSVSYNSWLMTLTSVTFGPVGNSNGGGRTLGFSTPAAGVINVSVSGTNEFQGSGALVHLNFQVTGYPGTSTPVDFTSFQYNSGSPCAVTTNGSVVVASGTISGTITYANVMSPPFPRAVPNVLISAFGAPSFSTVTNSSGAYSLSGFGPGTYTMTPSKSGGVNGAITGFDAAQIAQYVVNLTVFNTNQLIVADVSGNGQTSSFDASMVARYAVALPQTELAGNWIFSPVSITRSSIFTNINNENYAALLMGDVSGSWLNSGSRPESLIGPVKAAEVNAPNLVASTQKEIIIPVTIDGAANSGIIAYQFDLRYDPSVIQPKPNAVDLRGTVSSALSTVFNASEPGLLKVTVYGPMQLDADGLLLNLRFTAVGAPGSSTPLTWESLMLNEGDPQVAAMDGSVVLVRTASPDKTATAD